jgi:hypothetical protein
MYAYSSSTETLYDQSSFEEEIVDNSSGIEVTDITTGEDRVGYFKDSSKQIFKIFQGWD